MNDFINDDFCDWCGINVTLWSGRHEKYCPHELLDFLRLHICKGGEADYQICIPCADKTRELVVHDWTEAEGSRWDDPKFHTEFCREFRAFMAKKGALREEALPKIQKRPESET